MWFNAGAKMVGLSSKPIKYIARQSEDIIKFGEHIVERANVTENILEELTPFRRLSKKGSCLSEPTWFIANFEKREGKEFLPKNWALMSVDEKADYIVKDRYRKLVANKIMNKIKIEPQEILYVLNKDGDIINITIGEEVNTGISKIYKNVTTVHNHPSVFFNEKDLIKLQNLHKEVPYMVHSGGDAYNSILYDTKSYVVTPDGHKFLLEPQSNMTFVDRKFNASEFEHRITNAGDLPAIDKELEIYEKMQNKALKYKKIPMLFGYLKNKCINFRLSTLADMLEKRRNILRNESANYGCRFVEIN